MREPVFESLDARDREAAKWEAKSPVCDLCGESILDEYFYKLGGLFVCWDCINSGRRLTEDYINENV